MMELEIHNFQKKLEKVQYKACIEITDAIQETLRQKIYNELVLHRWRSKLSFS